MARSSRGRFPLRSGVRRRSSWSTGAKSGADGIFQDISATGPLLGGIVASPTLDGMTLVRTRGELLIQLTTATDVSDGFYGAFGIGIANEEALDVGVTAVPTPKTEEDWDGWLYHTYFSVLGI